MIPDLDWENPDAVLRTTIRGEDLDCRNCRHQTKNLPRHKYRWDPAFCERYYWTGYIGTDTLPAFGDAKFSEDNKVCRLFNDLEIKSTT